MQLQWDDDISLLPLCKLMDSLAPEIQEAAVTQRADSPAEMEPVDCSHLSYFPISQAILQL